MFGKLIVLAVLLTGISALSVVMGTQTLEVVPSVDLSRYAGKWYEIARLPNRFQKKCAGEVTAEYSLSGDQLTVLNQCRLNNGQTDQAKGTARLASKNGPTSKLEVRFAPVWLSWVPAVWGDYWVIDLAPDYSYSVVGTPDRKYLWVLSRTPRMDEALYQSIVQQVAGKGFDVSRLIKTRQSG